MFPRKEVLAMAVPAFLLTIGKVVTSPYTTATLLGANTIMNGVEIKQGEDLKASASRIESEQKKQGKLLVEILETQQSACTCADLTLFKDEFFGKLEEPVQPAESQPQNAQPVNNAQYSAESLDAAYQRGVAEANARAAADRAAAEKAASEAAAQKELADLRAQVAALKASAAAPATPPAAPPTTPPAASAPAAAPASDAEPAWLGKFAETLAKITADQVNTAVKSALTTPPASTEKKNG